MRLSREISSYRWDRCGSTWKHLPAHTDEPAAGFLTLDVDGRPGVIVRSQHGEFAGLNRAMHTGAAPSEHGAEVAHADRGAVSGEEVDVGYRWT